MCQCQKLPLQHPQFLSPYQLASGTNPKLPSMMSNRVRALTAAPSSKIISNNLKAIHKAREAFIASGNSEKIRRDLAHDIRTSGDIKYITVDHVYFKRADSREWHGPVTVLGQDGQQVLIKKGSSYVRVHLCQLELIPPSPRPTPETKTTTIEAPNQQNTKLTHCPTSFRPQNDSSSQEETSSSGDDQSNDKDTQDNGNKNTIPSKQQEHWLNRYHKTTAPTKIKPNITIEYKLGENSPWETVKALSPAGKVTGKYSNCWNTKNQNNFKQPIDFSKIAEWKIAEEKTSLDTQSKENHEMETTDQLSNLSLEEDEIQTHESLLVRNKNKTLEAKLSELQQCKSEVCEEVPDQGQNFISLRWLIKEKLANNKKFIKVRLCARGWEEAQNFKTDWQTCSKEDLCLTCSMIASNKWT